MKFLSLATNNKFSILDLCRKSLFLKNLRIMNKTKYSNQISKFLQKTPTELSELSNSEPGDAFLDHMLKKFDQHIAK